MADAPKTPEAREERRALATELPLIEDRLRRAGLWKTAVVMNKAVQAIGWEIAEVDPRS